MESSRIPFIMELGFHPRLHSCGQTKILYLNTLHLLNYFETQISYKHIFILILLLKINSLRRTLLMEYQRLILDLDGPHTKF